MKVIVKYYGSLDGVRAIADDVKVSELLAQYAVVDIDAAYLDELRNVPEVIYIEEPRRVYPTGEITKISATEKNSASDTQNEPGIMQGNIQENRLSGKGVLVGIVDSGDCVKKYISNNKTGEYSKNSLCNKNAEYDKNVLNNKTAIYNENVVPDEYIVYKAGVYKT